MKTSAYSIYDVKEKKYNFPMFVSNELVAIRNIQAAMQPGSMLMMFPNDYELYYIGEYDDETGLIAPCEPKYVGRCLDFKAGDDNEV